MEVHNAVVKKTSERVKEFLHPEESILNLIQSKFSKGPAWLN
jgi:hypothetical protein